MREDFGILNQTFDTDMNQAFDTIPKGNEMIFGYGRVSTKEQNPARQREALKNRCDDYFEDKLSGRSMERPQFQRMLEQLRPGDTVLVLSIDRLGRNLRELIELSFQLKEKWVNIVVLSQRIDTSTKMGELFYTLLAVFADLELQFIKERQKEGIEVAKKEGKYTGRPLKQLEGWEQLSKEVDEGKLSVERACKLLNISRSTFYRRRKLDGENSLEQATINSGYSDL